VKWRWRHCRDHKDVRGRVGTDFVTGSGKVYGSGAEVSPVDAELRREDDVPPEMFYWASAWTCFGHKTDERRIVFYARSVAEA